MNIYAGNLPYNTTEEDLKSLFAEHGSVSRATLIIDKQTGKSKGFGFVEMENRNEAEKAIAALNDKEINGRKLRINEAKPKKSF